MTGPGALFDNKKAGYLRVCHSQISGENKNDNFLKTRENFSALFQKIPEIKKGAAILGENSVQSPGKPSWGFPTRKNIYENAKNRVNILP